MSGQLLSKDTLLVDRYRVLNFLAAGGMQEVYLCHDTTLDRDVVVKTPKGGIKDRRFRRGAEMGARVNHSNVAATFDYFEDDKITFMVEEYLSGQDLGKRLVNEFHYMDPALAAHVTHHVARALLEAHRMGICHRDLKPGNIMTSADPSLSVIKLTDFGISKLAESEIAAEMELFDKDESTLTSSNTLLGAVPYMAPECWAEWRTAGQPMDIWALGCVTYQLLTGKPPFGTGRQAIANVLKLEQGKTELVKPESFGKHTSTVGLEEDLWSIVVSCIQVDPTKRPSARDVVAACDRLCYPESPRLTGTVESFRVSYAGGGKGNFGYIVDDQTKNSCFFHLSEFFGAAPPAAGQRVNFALYPGVPWSRSSPVLLIK